ncbi:MAG: transposase [Candidatus Saccharimonadales bacterium]
MPTRNIVKEYGEGEYYHAYNRGVAKMDIFKDDEDYAVLLNLFKRYLSPEIVRDAKRCPLPNYRESVDLVVYCLMPNHYHLLLYLKEKQGIEKLMRSVMTAYSGYFNKKYDRVGAIFQNHFLAARIPSDTYLWQVSRYIHLNPLDIGKDPLNYAFSSVAYYRGDKSADWLRVEHLVETGEEKSQYMRFVTDDATRHYHAHAIKILLANSAIDD